MAGNKESAKRGAETQKARTKARLEEVTKNDLGKGDKPGFGTGAWAKQHNLWREGDTEGPADKDPKPAKP